MCDLSDKYHQIKGKVLQCHDDNVMCNIKLEIEIDGHRDVKQQWSDKFLYVTKYNTNKSNATSVSVF